MPQVTRAVAEVGRIIVLLFISLYMWGKLELWILQSVFKVNEVNGLLHLANLMITFVLYRNYFQFKGWYKKDLEKLNPAATIALLGCSLVLIIASVL